MAMRDKIEHAIQNQPCTVKDLKNKFGGDRGADRKVMEAVDQLVHEAVICQRQGVFFTVRSGRADKALLCKVVKLGKNFAFVMLEDGTSDIFIPGRFIRGAMPGDKVLVEKFAHPRVEGSDEGEILAVLEEKNALVGTMHRMEGRLKFVPDDCPAISMQVMRDCEGSAKDGDKVAVEILLRGNRQEDHRVGVAMRFGSCDEAKRAGYPQPLPGQGAGRGQKAGQRRGVCCGLRGSHGSARSAHLYHRQRRDQGYRRCHQPDQDPGRRL